MLGNWQQTLWDRLDDRYVYLLKERNRTNSFMTAVKRSNTSTKSRRNFTNQPHWSHLLSGRLTQKAPLLWHYRRGVEALGLRCEMFRVCKSGCLAEMTTDSWVAVGQTMDKGGMREGGQGRDCATLHFRGTCSSFPSPLHEPTLSCQYSTDMEQEHTDVWFLLKHRRPELNPHDYCVESPCTHTSTVSLKVPKNR